MARESPVFRSRGQSYLVTAFLDIPVELHSSVGSNFSHLCYDRRTTSPSRAPLFQVSPLKQNCIPLCLGNGTEVSNNAEPQIGL